MLSALIVSKIGWRCLGFVGSEDKGVSVMFILLPQTGIGCWLSKTKVLIMSRRSLVWGEEDPRVSAMNRCLLVAWLGLLGEVCFLWGEWGDVDVKIIIRVAIIWLMWKRDVIRLGMWDMCLLGKRLL